MRAWAVGRGLRAGLPIDAVRSSAADAGIVSIPKAADSPAPFEVIRGDAPVEPIAYWSLPACIRAWPIGRVLERLRVGPGNGVEPGLRLSLLHVPSSDRWSGYTQGIRALRSALEKARWDQSSDPLAEAIVKLSRGGATWLAWETLRETSPWGAGVCDCVVAVRDVGLQGIHSDIVVPWDKAVMP